MNEQNETFHYTYSAAQQEEIDKIRKKYLQNSVSEKMDKIEQLRRLDAGVTKKAMIWSLTVGVIGTLIMGTGMSLIMTDIGDYLDITSKLFVGIVVGFIGMVGVLLAYPLYQRVLKKERKKIAPQILSLTDELSQK